MTQKDPGKTSWKKPMTDGLILLAGAAFVFWYLTDFENSHDASREMNWMLALLYNFGGKWLASSVLAAVGIWQLVIAVLRRNEEQ